METHHTTLFEEGGEGNQGVGACGAEFGYFEHALGGAMPGPAAGWIENPDVGDSEIEVVVDALPHFGEAVVFGEDLDADERRGAEDLFGRAVIDDHADVGDAEAGGGHLDALFGNYVDTPLLAAGIVIGKDCALKSRVIKFSQVTLQNSPVYIVTIGPVARAQVFVDADK
jgi:hypothetical protein